MAQSAAERRAAQRRTAKEIKTGTYVPSPIGRKSRELSARREQLIRKINGFKRRQWGKRPRYREKGNNLNTRRHQDGKLRETGELQAIADELDSGDTAFSDDWHAWSQLFGEDGLDDTSLFYH
jgi:hypothetical protein